MQDNFVIPKEVLVVGEVYIINTERLEADLINIISMLDNSVMPDKWRENIVQCNVVIKDRQDTIDRMSEGANNTSIIAYNETLISGKKDIIMQNEFKLNTLRDIDKFKHPRNKLKSLIEIGIITVKN